MSKGPGKWQRLILDQTDAGLQFYLAELLPHNASEAEYQALHRAAAQLEKKRKISMKIYRFGKHRVFIGPYGCDWIDRNLYNQVR